MLWRKPVSDRARRRPETTKQQWNMNVPDASLSSPSVKPANQRGAARLAAVQALYQMDVGEADRDSVLAQFAPRKGGGEIDGAHYLPADTDFLRQIVNGVIDHQLRIDPCLDLHTSADWPLSRLDATMRAILRAGCFELLYRTDIPPKVVISEYLDVANAFFDGEVPAMINAVLDRIARSRPPAN